MTSVFWYFDNAGVNSLDNKKKNQDKFILKIYNFVKNLHGYQDDPSMLFTSNTFRLPYSTY